MGNWPDYTPGQPVEHSARRENEINAILKSGNLLSGGLNFARSPQSVRIQAYNATTAEISPGQPVQIDITGTMSGDAFPAVAFDDEDTDAPFGVFEQAVAVNGMAPLVLSGPATVTITGSSGGYAKPLENGTFERGDEGVRILNLPGNGKAVVLLGDYKKIIYEAGTGISKTDLTGGTISTALVQGSNVTLTPDPVTGTITISATGGGGGGGGIPYPPYSALSFGGGAPEYGLGHTFIIPVEAGEVGFYDDGGGAVAKWANISGTTTQVLTSRTAYNAPEDGWLRISVVDNGLAPGRCLGFTSPSGGFPLYKYGSFSVSGIGYPDYVALAGGTFSNALGTITDDDYEEGDPVPGPSSMPQDPKLGITYFLPVPANAPIKYYASAAVLVRFAPVSGGGHYYYDLSNELEWTPNSAGWLRISILDDGSHSSDCIRLYVGGVQWADAVPLYKCGKFQNGATGISSSISGSTVTISLTGGSGSVKFVAGTDISITGSGGVYTISASGGGGGGFIPNWRHGGHSGVIPPDNGSNIPYTAAEEGYIFAWASFDPFKDGLRYRNYAAHVSINGGLMKVAELKLPGESAYIKANSTSFERDTTKDYSNKIRVEVYDENAGEWVKKVYTRDYSDDYYDSDEDEYTYFAWYCYNAPEDYKTLYSDDWNIRGGESVYTKDDSGEETVFSYLTDCEFYPEYYLFAWVNGNTTVYTYSGSITAGSTNVYMPNQRGEFESTYTVTETNADNFVVAIGAGLPIPYRKGASIRFIVTADGYPYGTLVNYENPGTAPAVCCLVYEKPAQQENNES
jgi:hypothetical protein